MFIMSLLNCNSLRHLEESRVHTKSIIGSILLPDTSNSMSMGHILPTMEASLVSGWLVITCESCVQFHVENYLFEYSCNWTTSNSLWPSTCPIYVPTTCANWMWLQSSRGYDSMWLYWYFLSATYICRHRLYTSDS